jgi:hypothetical protein
MSRTRGFVAFLESVAEWQRLASRCVHSPTRPKTKARNPPLRLKSAEAILQLRHCSFLGLALASKTAIQYMPRSFLLQLPDVAQTSVTVPPACRATM